MRNIGKNRMKAVAFVILLSFSLCLYSCTSAVKDTTEKMQGTESAPLTVEIPNNGKSLYMLRNSNNRPGTYTSRGFYRLITLQEDSSNIVFVDFESKQMIFLCDQPTCKHIDETCKSWLGSDMAGSSLVADEKILYVFTNFGEVFSTEPDGSNRTKLYSMASGCQLYGDLASDGENLFFIQMKILGPKSSFSLVMLNPTNQSLNELKQSDDMLSICGVDGRSLIITRKSTDGKLEIERFAVDTQDSHTLYTGSTLQEYGCANSQYYVYIDYSDKAVKKYDYKEKKVDILMSKIDIDESTPIYINELTDDHLAFTIHRTNAYDSLMEKDYVAIDLLTGKVTDSLPLSDDMGDQSVAVIAACYKDSYLVRYAIKDTLYHILMKDGTTNIQSGPLAQYAMIKKTDYWAGIPNYEPIDVEINF